MNKLDYLSKSAFKLGLDCRTKLFYRKNGYSTEMSSFNEQMIDDGYKIGKFAQIVYGPGVKIDIDYKVGLDEPLRLTEELLKNNENITIFEAAFFVDNKLVIVDILEKLGDVLLIKEVKSKSLYKEGIRNDKNKNGTVKAEWKDYYLDITFQYYVISKYIEHNKLNYVAKPFLVLVDNTKKVKIDGLSFMFETVKDFDTDDNSIFNSTIVFTGEDNMLKANNILVEINVEPEVKTMLLEIEENSKILIQDLNYMKLGKKFITPINVKCKKCEFTAKDNNGYEECWGNLAKIQPHIFDLYYGTSIGGYKNPYFNELIAQQKSSLFDIDINQLTNSYSARQKIQILYTKDNKSWYSTELKSKIKEFKYPLCFIDFETARLKIPPYKDMRPNDLLAFQWSCHIVKSFNEEPLHFEFFNNENAFPNFVFAETLMNTIDKNGTFFMWSSHEMSTLKRILNQMNEFNFNNSKLKEWLELITNGDYFVDMYRLSENYYFHPNMKGSNKLKDVLPAIWNNYSTINRDSWFNNYHVEVDGITINPYKVLKTEKIIEQAEIIAEGTGAIIGYQNFLNAIKNGNTTEASKWKNLLLQYCKLDTMAMVMVWKHWYNLLNIKGEDIPISN